MSILPMSLSVPATPQSLSSAKAISGGTIWAQSLCLTSKKLSHLSLRTTPIRMGGGPRTFPGGVSKWQWKRMQAKKAKQLLKARLARERQIYEMRKRAELKAAVSELERPWEAVEKPPVLFSVSADEQLKVLADRFQKPGGLDLWTERDGPELFRPDNALPASRFFPKGVVHSIKPYRKTARLDTTPEEIEGSGIGEDSDSDSVLGLIRENVGETGLGGKGYSKNSRSSEAGTNKGGNVGGMELRSSSGVAKEGKNRNTKGKFRNGNRKMFKSDRSEGMDSGNAGFYGREDTSSGSSRELRRNISAKKSQNLDSEVFDMSLQNDGSYGFEFGELSYGMEDEDLEHGQPLGLNIMNGQYGLKISRYLSVSWLTHCGEKRKVRGNVMMEFLSLCFANGHLVCCHFCYLVGMPLHLAPIVINIILDFNFRYFILMVSHYSNSLF